MNKRPADSPATKNGPTKKITSSASSAPKQQSSLLAWAKPKATAAVTTDATATGTINGDKTSSQSASAPLVLKAKPDILKGLSDEKRELLRLEQDTIDATWLRALQSEFTKPYFIEVRLFRLITLQLQTLEYLLWVCTYNIILLPLCALIAQEVFEARGRKQAAGLPTKE